MTNGFGTSFPVSMEVKCDPRTGSARPFEIWATWGSGTRKNVGSFKTEAAAIKSRNERWARIEAAKARGE